MNAQERKKALQHIYTVSGYLGSIGGVLGIDQWGGLPDKGVAYRVEVNEYLSELRRELYFSPEAEELEDGLVIRGGKPLAGGTVDSFGDHRIAMLAAVASVVCDSPVTITGAEAIRKSYPTFWEDLRALGKEVAEEP